MLSTWSRAPRPVEGGVSACLTLDRTTGVISGTVRATALSVTTDYNKGVKSGSFRLTARVSDGKKAAQRALPGLSATPR